MAVNTTNLSAIPNVGASKSEWIDLDGEASEEGGASRAGMIMPEGTLQPKVMIVRTSLMSVP